MIADAQTLSRLRWSARRGLLENDLIIERFFNRYIDTLSMDDVFAMDQLLDLSDNDLLDLLLKRKEPAGVLDNPDVIKILQMMRQL
ncbi:succinate dehydrogenase assembly factor 2 [Polynucleobacter sp. SHI8]|uniref:FAD assembly factor SdhE n=1 Tax=unclassified Polynucleobacter TaxID=2640945 RepID=UPI002491760B|nr:MULTISPECIES: succinate dehydrogenase assembly factor 2 [unclassified Polynucleobacter]BDW11203.1 succinate dehydrogenase assembly factor 2 [Polynucleobacter sp. SHI2]BDW13649.1 succinate dehydrogenase assembly factor 2 [Polynucleobacter sp. SHI8]